jgi:hypothetical protein
VARHSSEHEPDADEADDKVETDEPDESEQPERTAQADTFWSDVRVDPIEVALPSGVGYTLRAYRDPDDVSSVPGDEPEPDEDEDAADEAVATESTEPADEDLAEESDEASDDEDSDDESDEDSEDDDELDDEDEDDEEEEDDEDEEDQGPDEVPVFLSARGKLLLFRSTEGLAAFLRSDDPHSLRGIEEYETLTRRIEPGYVVPTDEDRYELDLVVSNLRGGHDAWEPELVVKAGELARDLGYALRLQTVLTSLAPGSPLDDLDDAMRAAAGGGIGGFRGRRRMRKVGAQQAALAWRTIIGKISAAVDWRD